ncbi:antibiotic biosynthesis monooxygenase family protein [Umezawaea sp.]|uniref:antibiotic biosynthesis monooxygenase family protein n=1 Tax=Umezawaea sp. TaxID=1955258 RepID=UPI002ED0BF20
MFRVVLTMRVAPGREDRFLDVVRAIGAAVAANPANLDQRLFRDDAGTFHVCSDWADAESFRAHERDPEHRRLIAGMRDVREDSTMTTMVEVDAFEHSRGGRPPHRAASTSDTCHEETSSSGVADS